MLLVLYKKVLIFILPECEVLYMKQSREKLLNPGFRIPLIRICDERIRPSRGDIMTTTSNPHIVPVHPFFSRIGLPYMILKYVPLIDHLLVQVHFFIVWILILDPV